MKKILIILAIILLAIVGYWAWLKFSPNKFLDGFYLVPQDAVMVIETEDPIFAIVGLMTNNFSRYLFKKWLLLLVITPTTA